MSRESVDGRVHESAARRWGSGVVGGLVGGVAMGVILHVVELLPLIGAVFGSRTYLVGWLGHLLMSVFFGLVFVLLVSLPFIRDFTETFGGTVGMGVFYGAMLLIFSGGIMLPLIVMALGQGELPLPLLPIPMFVEVLTLPLAVGIGHLLYGTLLGIVYAGTKHGWKSPEN